MAIAGTRARLVTFEPTGSITARNVQDAVVEAAAGGGGGGGGAAVTIAATAPASPSQGDLWLRLLSGASTGQLYAWDSDQETWQQASAGVGGGGDTHAREVGLLIGDPDDGQLTGLQITAANETVRLVSTDSDGNENAQIAALSSQAYLEHANARFLHDATGWRISGLPASDPAVDGYLWNDGGTVKVSAGV